MDIFLPSRLFVVDEPFANLDPKSGKIMLKEIERYTKDTKSCVIILDQKILPEFYDSNFKKNWFGEIYTFKKSNGDYKLVKSRVVLN